MAWTGVITNAGSALLDQWALGGTLQITAAATGTGTVAVAALTRQTALVSQKQTASIVSSQKLAAGIKVKLQITAPATGYTLNQYGIWARLGTGAQTLLALFQKEEGVVIPSAAETPDFAYTLYALLTISNDGELEVTIDASALVTQSTMESYVEEATAEFSDHLTDTANPHQVTKTQVGLGNVPNVATNNQTPTYTEASSPANLTSGEKLSVAFGKIARAVRSLIAHLADTTAHITAAERTAWNGKQGALTFDSTPTAGSTNPVTSGGVKTYADTKLPLAGGTLSGNVTVQRNGTVPTLTLSAPEKADVGRSKTALYKNANTSADNGTQLTDYVWGDGTTANQRTTLRLQSIASELKNKMVLVDYAAGGDYVLYHLYGEHNPPGMGSVTGLTAALDGKVDKVSGKGLSTNDYTTAEKTKLAGIAAGAQVNSITGVKGNAETNYRTGNVNLTPANLGAAPASHSHDYLPLAGGTLTGDLMIQLDTGIPSFSLRASEKEGVGRARMMLYKEAGSTDYGTWLIDYTWDNSLKTALVLRNAAVALRDRLTLRNYTGSTSTTYHLFGEHNPPAVADVDGLQTALNGKSNTGHTHNYLPLSGGTLTGDATVQKNIPRVTFATEEKANVGRARMILYKNASATVDNGTQLADYVWGDGGVATNKNARLTLRAAVTDISSLLTLAFNEGEGGSTVSFKLYGEHNKPYVTAGQKSGTTLGEKATAEGYNVTASGAASHAEGEETVASAKCAHAEGTGTIASAENQHVFGKYNVSNDRAVEIVGWGTNTYDRKDIRSMNYTGDMWIAGTLSQASDARLKDIQGEVPDVSGIRAVRFKWNDTNGEHDEKDHIGYIAQDVEAVAPYLVGEDSNGYKSLDYIALLCAKVEMLERQVRELTEALSGK